MKKPSPNRAFALVLVLITLMLVATMAVLFLSGAGRERRGVDMYARGSHVRNLAEMTVNRVIGQINAATKEGTASAPVSWASQPGMIRTYDADGDARNVYKLYSWDNLLEAGGGFDPAAASQVPPAGWKANTALFTDLNQPVNGIYPIVDPQAEGAVEGFSIDKANAAVAGADSLAPMPVKWLYVLEDGRMVSPSGGSGSSAVVPGASADNPIIGRVAFWTDDETSKVNVNTAGEGAYWDWPKAATYDEMQFAGNPPVTGEYNRTPGHPAMTSLSAVFPELDPGQRWSNITTYRTRLKDILALTPKVPYDDKSSRGGTYPIETASFDYGPVGALPAIPNAPLAPKAERLFVSPDEVIFRYPGRALQASVTPTMLQRRAFFLTSQSRAPETTLFETPRVSLWPVTWPYPSTHAKLANRQTAAVSSPFPDTARVSDNTWMRAEERLLAFVSTLNQLRPDGGDRYYFQRQNPESSTYDYDHIRRNRDLLAYLRELTSRDIPGYGGSFQTKYGAIGRDSILANGFNVVRSLVNQYTLQDDGRMLYSFTPVAFTRFINADGSVRSSFVETGAFSPAPMRLNLGAGEIATISEFPVLREAALVFYATDRAAPARKSNPTVTNGAGGTPLSNYANPRNWDNLINLDSTNGYPVGAMTTQMRAVLLLDFGALRGSTRNNAPIFWVKLEGNSLSADGQSLGFNGAVARMDYRAVGAVRNYPTYLLPFFQKGPTGAVTDVQTVNNGTASSTNYGLISVPITVPRTATRFNFTGGPITVKIYGTKPGDPDGDPTGDSSLLLASKVVDFSGWTGQQPIPLSPWWNYYELNKDQATQVQYMMPNPNFQASDPAKVSTKWAALEIAPPYKTAASTVDPVIMPAGYGSVPAYSGLFKNESDGTIIVPGSKTGLGFAVTYARRDDAGARMTDYEKRIRFIYNTGVADVSNAANGGFGGVLNGNLTYAWVGGFPSVTAYDTVMSVVVDPQGPGNGDPRLGQEFTFARVDQVIDPATPMREVMPLADYPRLNRQYHTLGTANQMPASTGYITSNTYSLLGKGIAPDGMAIVGAQASSGKLGAIAQSTGWTDADAVGVNSALPQAQVGANGSVGDWSSEPGYIADGGAIQRADQDFQAFSSPAGYSLSYQTPYFRFQNSSQTGVDSSASKGYFSPNRQIPSPIGLLGAIPTSRTAGWQTLLFSPNPAAGSAHPGLTKPADYLFLDLFWMPVVEPYPISEEFSTAGKVNLNYQIAPFSYIKRRTALHALLKSTWITALNNSLAHDYKAHDIVKGMANTKTRYEIDAAETIDGFDHAVFDGGDLFRSAAQICQMWLVPQGRTSSNVEAFWTDKLLSSDTAREEPYNNLYSRLTTKSNTYTVHWRVQVLRKSPSGSPGAWDETKDRIASDLRGSTLIERYLDPNATDIPDYATDPSATPLSHYYKWRVVSENFFQP